MRVLPPHSLLILCAGAILVSACGGGGEAATKVESCRETAAADLSPVGHGCALAAELQAIADTLATVVDRESANKAIPILEKSRDRMKALKKERLKLNEGPNAGAKGALMGATTPAISAASRAMIDQYMRLMQSSPELGLLIGPALEGAEI